MFRDFIDTVMKIIFNREAVKIMTLFIALLEELAKNQEAGPSAFATMMFLLKSTVYQYQGYTSKNPGMKNIL